MIKNKLFNLIVGALLLISLNGCVSATKDVTAAALEEAESKMRLKWAEDWRPALMKEAQELAIDAKEAAVTAAVVELEKYKLENEGRLAQIGIQVENFDLNQDGQISGAETLALLKEIKNKNESSPNPLEWWEILLAVGAAYVPLTGAKELARSRMGPRTGSA